MRALNDVIRQGKVRYVGCSNFPAWRVVDAVHVAAALGAHRFVSCQDEYSLLARYVDPELIPAMQSLGLGMLPSFPLAGGMLTRKYGAGPCCDERSQCQALERTQLGLPLAPNRPRTMTHDYARHGTVTLFAALIVLTGRLITGRCPYACRMAALPKADRPRTPRHLDLHLDRGTTTHAARAEVACGAVRFGRGRVHTKLGVRVLW